MKIALRAIEATDAALLAATHAAVFAEAWDEKSFATLMATPGTFGVLAGVEQPMGFILCRAAADEAEILTLLVPEAFRRAGIATALMDRAISEAKGAGIAALFLEVAEDNAPARAFYVARGFKEIGRRRGYYRNAIDAIMMKRAL